MAPQRFKNGCAHLLRPPCDDLSDRVIAEGVTRNGHGVLTHLVHDVLLLVESSGSCHDNLDDAKAVSIDAEAINLLLNLLKNKVENSIECF